MSQIYHEFERQLADWHEQYLDDPEREILCLYLLALEREENVVVAYDDAVFGRRVAALHIPVAVRELMRSALARVRLDEQMHVLDARAALLEFGTPMVGIRRLVHQMAGAMGGWTASVRQHRRWSRAPVSRAAATLLLWAGRVTGRVPGSVWPHLDFLSVRDFCRYNVQTESTARLCWQQLAELASTVPALSRVQVEGMRRVAEDEDRHRRVFATLASTLTADDRLQHGATEEHLAARLGDIGRHFLPGGAMETADTLQGGDGADVDDAPEYRTVAPGHVGC